MVRRLRNSLYILLRQSEQYTKTDMVYVARGGFWSVAGSIATTIIAAAVLLAFANLLPKESYGTYQYILTMIDLFGIFALAGMDTAVGRSTARGLEGSWKDALSVKIRWGLIGGAGSLMLGLYYIVQGNSLLGGAFMLAGLLIPFWEAASVYSTYLQGKKRFDLLNSADVVMQLGSALAVICTLLLTDNILILLTVYLVTYGTLRLLLLLATLRVLPPNDKRDPELVPYGKKLTWVSVMGNLASNADKIIIWQFLGPASVAIYAFSQSIPLRAIGFLKIINRLAFPKMAAQENDQLQGSLMRKILPFVAVSAIGALAYAAAAPYLFAWFLPQYVDAVPYTIVVGLLIALQPFSLISSAFTAQAMQREIWQWSIATPIMRLALFACFIPLWGLWGAVFALVGSKAAESALLVALFLRRANKTTAAI
ncbi:MAG: oligosaccharide flippase family protein [Candidatus Pacebacteria bacterium]|nr:oligosaccharide flippase family protein [Candidatus Paceibacterota bacterium]